MSSSIDESRVTSKPSSRPSGNAEPFFEPIIYDAAGNFDHSRAPLLEGLAAYRKRDMVSFATPGHKLGIGMDPEVLSLYGESALMCDIPVSGGADSIHFGSETWRLAEQLGADAWGADRTFYLVNGSSTGNLAFLLGCLKPDDKVIVARDMHKSLMVALIQTGAKPVYVAPKLHPHLNIGLGVEASDIAAALGQHPDAKMVILVSPSYCGVSSDLASIAQVVHDRAVPLYVDEAWGPHFHFHPALPPSAMDSGADGAVASTHKVLGAFTQSAVLHIRGSLVDQGRIAATVGMSQTTSPATFILATIDACRRQMMLHGRQLLDRAISLAEEARTRLQHIPGVTVLDGPAMGILEYDLTKLVIDVQELGLTGFEVEDELRYRYQINPEMSDLTGIVGLITIGDTQRSIDRLVNAFEDIAANNRGRPNHNGSGAQFRSSGAVIAPGIQAMSPREAFFSQSRAIPLASAAGEISAELVIPYPPGIPVLAPGEVITVEKLDYLKFGAEMGMYISGASDHNLETIRVVDEPRKSAWLPQPYYSNLPHRD